MVVGNYNDGGHGFLYNPNSQTYTTLDDPLATTGTVGLDWQVAGVGDFSGNAGIFLLQLSTVFSFLVWHSPGSAPQLSSRELRNRQQRSQKLRLHVVV
jgi:hypothetical protein